MSKCPLAGQGIWPRKGTRGKIHCIEGTLPGKEEESMGSIGKKIFTVAVGLALAAGIPHPATTAAHAGSGGDGCECPRGGEAGRGPGGGGGGGGDRGKNEGRKGRAGGRA